MTFILTARVKNCLEQCWQNSGEPLTFCYDVTSKIYEDKYRWVVILNFPSSLLSFS